MNAKSRRRSRSCPRTTPRVPGGSGHRVARARPGHAAAYALLDLIPFFTTGPEGDAGLDDPPRPEAQDAAGRIHTDLARGFIRAEVIEWDRLVEAGSEAEAKRRGWVRVEGRDYVVADGDTLNVRFNV